MLKNETVANYLTERLNAVGMAKQFKFKVFADAADFEKSWTIQGVLVDLQSDGLPVEGLTARTYDYAVSFNVIDHDLGTRTGAFNDVVTQVVSNLQGASVELDGGRGIFVFDTPTTRGVGSEAGLGVVVYTGLRFKILYTENVTTTSSKVWTLDGAVIPYLEESVELEKQGATNSVYGLKASQSLPVKQTKYYRFVLPFDNSSPICARLQRDMLEGDMTKIYTLSYYDGVSYTQDNPYSAAVSLFRTGKSGAAKPSVSNFTVIFTDTDDGMSGPVLYEMALIDNPFDSGTINTRYFESRAEQQTWFAQRIAAGAPYSPVRAPNLNSLTITQQIYILPAGSPLSLYSLLMKNYAIIKAVDRESGAVLDYYYYYVETANVGANNQILVDLKMDTIQTYFFNPDLKIAPCMIQRAHLNRWIDNGDGTVSFDNSPDSPMLNNEGVDLPKRLAKRTPITFGIQTNGNNINNYIKTLKTNWVLIYMKENETIAGLNPENPISTLSIKDADINLYCLVAPLSTTDRLRYYINGNEWHSSNLFVWILENKLASYVVNMKITPNCPLAVDEYTEDIDYTIQGALDIKRPVSFNLDAAKITRKDGNDTFSYILAFLKQQSNAPAFFDYELPYETNFSKTDIANSPNSYKFNPKFLSPGIRELRITDYAGNSYSYDMQKINSKTIRLLCTESLTSDITKGYIRIQDMEGSCYANGSDYNYTGLVYSNDTSIPFSVDQLDQFLAFNKNYALMQQAQRDYSREMGNIGLIQGGLSGATSMIANAANGNVGGSVTGAIGTISNALFGGFKIDAAYELSKQMQSFTIDNMRAAPSDLKNAQGNALFSSTIDAANFLGLYIDIYEFLEQDGKKIHDNLTLFGFEYERVGELKNFINIRHYFNFLQADLQTMLGVSMSNDAREDIRRRFAAGVRFWNIDELDYSKENYENTLLS